jgi:hypothetical protein
MEDPAGTEPVLGDLEPLATRPEQAVRRHPAGGERDLAVVAGLGPITGIRRSMRNPGVSVGTISWLNATCDSTWSPSVRHITVRYRARLAWLVNHFRPLITHSSPSIPRSRIASTG